VFSYLFFFRSKKAKKKKEKSLDTSSIFSIPITASIKAFSNFADYFREVDRFAALSTFRKAWPVFHLLGRLHLCRA
jgi:hypothetical protein